MSERKTTRVNFTEDEARDIWRRFLAGEPTLSIGRSYGRSKQTISNVVHRCFRHLPEAPTAAQIEARNATWADQNRASYRMRRAQRAAEGAARRKQAAASRLAARQTIRKAQDEAIRAWWPKASAREIWMMVDLGADVVVSRAKAMGFAPRPYSAKPEGA